jgi:hypothetical protein
MYMATTDEYAFMSSSTPQSVDSSPYSEKNFNNINDINSGVYSNNSGLTLVQFDAASIYNSAMYTDLNDAFLTIPLVMEAVYVIGGSTSATGSPPPVASHGLLAMKNGFMNLVHQVEISSGGQVIQNMQPFTNVLKNVKFMSNMSATDLRQLSSSYGFANELDGTGSQKWFTQAAQPTSTTGALNGGVFPGTGLTNNQAYLNMTNDISGTPIVGPSSYTSDSQTVAGLPNSFTVNPALQKRINRVTSSKSNAVSSNSTLAALNYVGGSNIYGDTQSATSAQPVIMTASDLSQEFRSYHTQVGNKMVWYDTAVIPLKWLCDSMRAIGLTKKFDAQIRLYLNTGSLITPITFCTKASPGVASATGFPQYGTPTSSTFANTCPYTVNTLPFAQATSGTDGFLGTATTANLVSGLFVAKSPTTSISVGSGPAIIDLGGLINPMPSCRLYYSQIKLEPSRALAYEQENRAKECVYEDFIFNQYSAIPAQGTFSQLIQSGIRNPLALCVIPLISSTTPVTVGSSTTININQYSNPYDTCPSTFAPISLTNFQVAIGGTNVFKSGSLFYSFENFLEQFVLADNVVAGVGAANVGVIDQKFWEASRIYWADLSRSTDADKASMRNLVLSFKNNSQVPIDLLVFTVYSNRITLDVANGRVALL